MNYLDVVSPGNESSSSLKWPIIICVNDPTLYLTFGEFLLIIFSIKNATLLGEGPPCSSFSTIFNVLIAFSLYGESFNKKDLFRRFALDNIAAIHLLKKNKRKLLKEVENIYYDCIEQIGTDDLEKRIKDVRNKNFEIKKLPV